VRALAKIVFLMLVLVVPRAAVGGAVTWPRIAREITTAVPDSIRLRMLAMIASGDIKGAVSYYLLATGATTGHGFTGPAGLVAQDYMSRLVNGRLAE